MHAGLVLHAPCTLATVIIRPQHSHEDALVNSGAMHVASLLHDRVLKNHTPVRPVMIKTTLNMQLTSSFRTGHAGQRATHLCTGRGKEGLCVGTTRVQQANVGQIEAVCLNPVPGWRHSSLGGRGRATHSQEEAHRHFGHPDFSLFEV